MGQEQSSCHHEWDPPRLARNLVNIILLGQTGTGKSASGNTILGKPHFRSVVSASPVTRKFEKGKFLFNGECITVIDSPDHEDMDRQTLEQYVRDCKAPLQPGPCVYLLVLQLGRFTDGERYILENLEKAFDQKIREQTIILFTHGDSLDGDNTSLEAFVNRTVHLKDLVKQCGDRYHVFDNKKSNRQQVPELMKKVYALIGPSQDIMEDDVEEKKKISVALLGKETEHNKALVKLILEKDCKTSKTVDAQRGIEIYENARFRITTGPRRDTRNSDTSLVVINPEPRDDILKQIDQLETTSQNPLVVLPLDSLWILFSEMRVPAEDTKGHTGSREDRAKSRRGNLVNIILLGQTGTGKSASGNTILGKPHFPSVVSASPVTKKFEKGKLLFNDECITVIDSPDHDDIDRQTLEQHVRDCKALLQPGPCVYLLVLQLGRFTDGERYILEDLEKAFDQKIREQTIILFTHGDSLDGDNTSLEAFVDRTVHLKDLVKQCGDRYHVFDNKKSNGQQVPELMKKVSALIGRSQDMEEKKISVALLGTETEHNKALVKLILEKDCKTSKTVDAQRGIEIYENARFRITTGPRKDTRNSDTSLVVINPEPRDDILKQIDQLETTSQNPLVVLPLDSLGILFSEMRVPAEDTKGHTGSREDRAESTRGNHVNIILLGQTGTGKSASGNTILGKPHFRSVVSASPVTLKCEKGELWKRDVCITVIDSPDHDDIDRQALEQHVRDCKALLQPGPCVYLLVMQLGSFTDGERYILENLEKAFDQKIREQTIILFTHGDNLDTSLEAFVNTSTVHLKDLLKQCGDRYHVFDNKKSMYNMNFMSNRPQVPELLKKVYALIGRSQDMEDDSCVVC